MSNKHLNAQYNLRWPDELKEKVARSAKAYNRSMNADIVARLEQSFIDESDLSPLNMPPIELEERLNRVLEKRALNNESIESLDLQIQDSSEKDKKIEQLEEQLANSMKMMEMITGMFESMLNGTQDEYMNKIFTQYPNIKKFYKEKTNPPIEDEEK